jgi:hypothetical protein
MANLSNQKRRRRAEIVISLLFLIVPLTVPAMGILWKCLLWMVAWGLFLDFVHTQVRFLRELWWPRKLAVCLVATTALVAFVYDPIYATWRAEKAAETSGVLKAVSDGKDHSNDPLTVEIGEGGTRMVWAPGMKGPIFDLTLDVISLKRVNGELLFSTTIKDRNENLIVEVKDNRWTVSPSKTNCWDKNYSQDSLEVKDGRGRVVLQVRMFPDRMQLQAEWPTTHNGLSNDQFDMRTGIVPMFKYPSAEYWGERAN